MPPRISPAATAVVHLPKPKTKTPVKKPRAPLTEAQRNARTIFGRQSKLSRQQHLERLHETGEKHAQRIVETGYREQGARRTGTALIERRADARIRQEREIGPLRTQQRIIQQEAAERSRTRGYLIRHTGSRAITSTGNALRPSVNPISLAIFVMAGLILFYLLVSQSSNTGKFLTGLGDAIKTLSSTKPLFVEETK